ncbi:hypothetical protein SUGI_0604010 [Cryptomeria japonica]|uniref:small ribosomal subunit protein uS9c n=1 Tax=Cryptomeria japonica TaxID=3369 RepID=UPI0024147CB4|nr:small ribosomal subunit protein uS9c [Cryptomeria japonica]GLJ30512.1 hypothetical protein SUGI_0604010 [Cryptomeria japonica]
MAIAVGSLTATFASLSISSQTLHRKSLLGMPLNIPKLKLCNEKKISRGLKLKAVPVTVCSAEEEDLTKYVKSKLLGGFAAQRIMGTGRRKSAVARVVLLHGTGQIIINNRTAQDYLQGNPLWLQYLKHPLALLGYENKYDVFVKARGGGLSGQAQAILLGIARALCVASADNRDPLRKQGLLTRDSRRVERKKVGLHKARKAPQYSKR